MSISLYELPLELERVLASETEFGDKIDPQEQANRIKEFLASSVEAVEQSVEYIKNLEMEIGEIDTRIDSLKAKKEARAATITRIKDQLLFVIDQVMNGKVKTVEWTAFSRESRTKSVEVLSNLDFSKVDKRFIRETITIDKEKIKQAEKEGLPLPEGIRVIETRSRSLIIK